MPPNNPHHHPPNNPHHHPPNNPNRSTNNHQLLFPQRMGILIHLPPPHQLSTPIRWSHTVIGMFFDHNPPNTSYVTNIVNNHWETRESIHVFRIGAYFIFECQNLLDREAIITLNTTFIDGKVLTFRPSSENQVPSSINFNMARIWVRIQDLPWNYLNTEWTIQILSHVGLVEAIEGANHSLPQHPFLRARLVFDITKSLIPGCFIPVEGNRLAWIYFRYEGIYKFCKECGCIGHNTGRCPLSAYEARRFLMRRIQGFEESGMLVLRTNEGIPLYTNLIRGLGDRFIHRNPRINLHHIRPQMVAPSLDPYLLPHLYNHNQTLSDSSSDEFYDTSPDFPPQRNNRHYQYYSDDNSQHHTNPPPDFSNNSYQSHSHHWASTSPSTRFGLSEETRASINNHLSPQSDHNLSETHAQLDLNLSPRPSSPRPPANEFIPPVSLPQHPQGTFPTLSEPQLTHNHTPENRPYQQPGPTMHHRLHFSHWAQNSDRLLNNLCGSIAPRQTQYLRHSPPSPSLIHTGAGPLTTLVTHGWDIQPSAPDEAGPSNWIERNAAAAVVAQGLELYQAEAHLMPDNFVDSPPELQNISNLINERFRISPPVFAYIFNPMLQEQLGEDWAPQDPTAALYSPTSPL